MKIIIQQMNDIKKYINHENESKKLIYLWMTKYTNKWNWIKKKLLKWQKNEKYNESMAISWMRSTPIRSKKKNIFFLLIVWMHFGS